MEKVCQRVAQHTLINVGVLRIGQLVGDTEKCVHLYLVEKTLMKPSSGVWNQREAWPLMFKSANTIGALPHLDEVRPMFALYRDFDILTSYSTCRGFLSISLAALLSRS